MQRDDLRSMATDELWDLYETATAQLSSKLAEEKSRLQEHEQRLQKLRSVSGDGSLERARRPNAPPKYQNPKNPAQTWCGRGRYPRWLTALLRSGKVLDSFLIDPPPAEKRL
jgi:DNA-binding protein H-NS